MTLQTQAYRPEIDGLRALAVGVVVLYHADLGFPGGFVGVDVFFVISGFLITSLIIKDLENDKFTFSSFWERRARRIIPAVVAMVLATSIASWFLIFPADLKSQGGAIAAQAVFCANVFFWRTSGYFGEPAEEQPLLHTWSLAVEEQFYFIIPLLLFGLFAVPSLRRRANVSLILLAVVIGSLALSIRWVEKHPTAAFFSLPSRAWELAIGATLAALPGTLPAGRCWLRELSAALGLGLIITPVFAYDKSTPFPGWAAVPPCLGTALIIWSNGPRTTWIGRSLALRPIVFVGLISYSLYLWHWPLLAFSRYSSLMPLTTSARISLVALSVAFAVISWKYVETPFRKRVLCGTKKAILTLAAAGLTGTLALGLVAIVADGFPGRFPPAVQSYYAATKDRAFRIELSAETVRAGKLAPLGNADKKTPIQLLVWGDSHAMAVLPAFDAMLKERSLSGLAATRSSTAPALGFYNGGSAAEMETRAFNEAVFEYVINHKISQVVLVGFWRAYSDQWSRTHPGDAWPTDAYAPSPHLRKCLIETVRKLVAAGTEPWILLQVPLQPFQVPKALAREAAFGENLKPFYAKPENWNGISGRDREFLDEIISAGGRLVDPRPRFLDPTGDHFIIARNGVPAYVDTQHLTTDAAIHLILPLLRDSIPLTSAEIGSR